MPTFKGVRGWSGPQAGAPAAAGEPGGWERDAGWDADGDAEIESLLPARGS